MYIIGSLTVNPTLVRWLLMFFMKGNDSLALLVCIGKNGSLSTSAFMKVTDSLALLVHIGKIGSLWFLVSMAHNDSLWFLVFMTHNDSLWFLVFMTYNDTLTSFFMRNFDSLGLLEIIQREGSLI